MENETTVEMIAKDNNIKLDLINPVNTIVRNDHTQIIPLN